MRYATPLPINRTPVSTVGGPFPPFCGTPDPSRSTGLPFRPWPVEHKAVSSVLRYARPRFHWLFRPSPPDEHDDAFRSDPAGWLPMNTMTTLFLCYDPSMYTSPGRTYARVGVRDPRPYVRTWPYLLSCTLAVRTIHAMCAPLLRHVPLLTRPRFIAAACK